MHIVHADRSYLPASSFLQATLSRSCRLFWDALSLVRAVWVAIGLGLWIGAWWDQQGHS